MSFLDIFFLSRVQTFILIFIRISGFFVAAPILGSAQVPARVKLSLAALISLVLFPVVNLKGIFMVSSLGLLGIAAAQEFVLGLLLGIIPSILLSAFQLAGVMIDYEVGTAFANVLDPISNQEISILGQFQLLLASTIFLLLEGHLVMIQALLTTFDSIRLGTFIFSAQAGKFFMYTLPRAFFEMALKLAAPVLMTTFLATLSLALASKIVPEINAFMAAFPLRIALALLVLFLLFPVMADFVRHIVDNYPLYLAPLSK